jgi:hypothetical protein
MPVTEPRDEIEAWLQADIEPLAPPPGTFERIHRRARRRKAHRALVSVSGTAVLVAAIAAAPRIFLTLQHHSGPASIESVTSPAPAPTSTPSPGSAAPSQSSSPASTRASMLPTAAALAPPGASSGAPVPRHFRPTSVTFIGVVGAVIGQAGSPGHCATVYCTSLAGTPDYGGSWYGVSAPKAGPPSGSAGVSQVRFLTLRNGWAFGPGLFVTHDGGVHWTPERANGLRVTDLETAGNRAFALFASCTGTGARYASGCTGLTLMSSAAGSNSWQPVGGVPKLQAGSQSPAASPSSSPSAPTSPAAATGSQGLSASLVLVDGPPGNASAGTGYLLAPDGTIFSGRLDGTAWHAAGKAPCNPGGPQQDGQPSAALLAADSGGLVMVCTGPAYGGSQRKVLWSSSSGRQWQRSGTPPVAGVATSLASAAGTTLVLATNSGLEVSHTSGRIWKQAALSQAGAPPAGTGFSYVGMTNQHDGVAVPADPSLGEVFITHDGGGTWYPSPIQGG